MTDLLKELRRLAEAATPGPWEPCLGSGYCEMTALSHQSQDGPGTEFVCDLLPDWAVELAPRKAENMEFIAKANPQTILALCSALERAMAGLERISGLRLGDALAQADAAYTLSACEAILKGEHGG